jgi:hypothetical protein
MSSSAQESNDTDLALSWSNDAVFATPQIASVPEEPGLLVLVRGEPAGPGDPYPVWVEAPDNLRVRARELAGHATVGPELGAILQHADLRFRYALVQGAVTRQRALERIRTSIVHDHD